MSLLKRTGSNLLWISLSDVFTKGAVIFVTIYLARILGAENFGLFSLGVAIASTVWPIVDLGTSGYGTREIARNKNNAKLILPVLNTMRIFVGLLVILVAAVILWGIDAPTEKSWVILSAMIYLVSFSLCPDWVLRGLEEMSSLFIINMTTSIVFIISIAVFIHSTHDTIEASLIRSVSFAVGSFVGLIVIYKTKGLLFYFNINVSEWINQIKNTHLFLLNRIVTNLVQFLPFFYVTYALSENASGIFAATHRLYIVGIAGIAAITSAIYPVLSDIYKNKNHQFVTYQKQLIQYLLYALIPFAFIGFFSSETIVDLLFGSIYSDSSHSLAIMLVTIPIVAIRSIFMFTLLSSGYEKYSIPAMMLAIIIQAITAYILIPDIGISGSAYAILIGEITGASFLYFSCRKHLSISSIFNKEINLLLITTLALSLMGDLYNWGLILSIIYAIPIYLALAHYLKILPIFKVLNYCRAKIKM